ncbi:hypothetical protein [Pelagicoccus sp. SDUM812003]|uniref:hypothetical protein n=1 Tax=Pelagicoccus sp. SDUM812003 TaxID=3041267 RepID=UPI00280EA61B|nr:hypothetical protein [Pelagicoccus sp. SDUM812003]MDQ8204516.1 hypothetical protein [Pelagicoccus sp. SDUM812003]
MTSKKAIAQLSFLLVSVFASNVVQAQSSLHCLMEGSWLPVAEVKGREPYCFTGDSLVRADQAEVAMLPEKSFEQGYIEVEVISNKRGGIQNREAGVQFVSSNGWYELIARLKPDRDLDDCYLVLRFDSFGDVRYYVQGLGDLKEGKAKRINVFTKVQYEMPQQLHLYSGMLEVRSSLVPNEYCYSGGELLFASK